MTEDYCSRLAHTSTEERIMPVLSRPNCMLEYEQGFLAQSFQRCITHAPGTFLQRLAFCKAGRLEMMSTL